MSKPTQQTAKKGARGPEGVPVDAPGNDAPAISPHAVSRMHRAEDDETAVENSPEFTDQPTVAHDHGYQSDTNEAESPGHASNVAAPGLDDGDPKNGEANPGHGTRKAPEDAPRGLGDGELMEQPDSATKAREPGAR